MKSYILITLAATLLFTGCAANTDAASSAGVNTQQAAAGTAEPAETTSVYAEVADIISNQVSLKVLRGSFDPSRMGGGGFGGERPPFDPNNMPSAAPDGSGGERPAFNRESMPSFDPENMPSFDPENMPEGFARRQGADGETRQSMPGGGVADADENPVDQQNMRYTGEELDVIIPIGTPIKTISFSSEDGSMQEKEADLANIKNGSTINIVYDSEKVNIKQVQIIDTSSMRRGARGGQGGQGGGFPGGGGAPSMGN